MLIENIPTSFFIVDTLYSEGDFALRNPLQSNEQASSVSLDQTFTFFGTSHTTVYVSEIV